MSGERSDLLATMSAARCIVFDKDGTLVDLDARWVPYFTGCVERIASNVGDPSLSSALMRVIGLDRRGLVPDGPAAVETEAQIVERVLAALVERGHRRADAVAAVLDAAATAEFGALQAIGEVGATFRHLRESTVRVGMATSDGRRNTERELAELGIADLVDTMRCGDDDGPVKPHPDVLVGISAELGCRTDETVFVGDSRQDLDSARAAGTRFVARCDPGRVPTWAAAEADAVVIDVAELIAYVGDGIAER